MIEFVLKCEDTISKMIRQKDPSDLYLNVYTIFLVIFSDCLFVCFIGAMDKIMTLLFLKMINCYSVLFV